MVIHTYETSQALFFYGLFETSFLCTLPWMVANTVNRSIACLPTPPTIFFVSSSRPSPKHVSKTWKQSPNKGIWGSRSFFQLLADIPIFFDRVSSKSTLIRFSNRKNGCAPINIPPERILKRFLRQCLYNVCIQCCFLSANHFVNVRALTSLCNTPIRRLHFMVSCFHVFISRKFLALECPTF